VKEVQKKTKEGIDRQEKEKEREGRERKEILCKIVIPCFFSG